MLKDVLTYNLSVVFCGTAKGKASAEKGFYYAGSGNKFYGILNEIGLTPYKLSPSECYSVNQYGFGLTDLVHSECGNDNEISKDSYEVVLFIKKIEKYKPQFIAFTRKTAASFALGLDGKTIELNYGLKKEKIGTSSIYILPSTSGSARRFWDPKWWFQLKKIIS